MSALSFVLNVLWIVFGGLWMSVAWIVAAIVIAITIIGLPWSRAAFNIALYTLLPFGQKAVPRDQYSGSEDIGTGPLGMLGNIIWLVLVAGIGPRDHRLSPCDHYHRDSLCLGALEACGSRAVADREDDCARRERAASLLACSVARAFCSTPLVRISFVASRLGAGAAR